MRFNDFFFVVLGVYGARDRGGGPVNDILPMLCYLLHGLKISSGRKLDEKSKNIAILL